MVHRKYKKTCMQIKLYKVYYYKLSTYTEDEVASYRVRNNRLTLPHPATESSPLGTDVNIE